ncbi:MAG: family 20 glycosylhydrolase [Lachnospiraceae bacterium]|nr:family 20 glycosylhydrolase [Lachnospiraceae bacterium]
MKRFLIISLLFWGQITYLAAINPKPFVIPEIKEWKGAEGALTITANSRIVIDKEYVELRQIATLLAQDWALLFGKELAITTGKATRGDIQLSFTSSKKIGNEAYAISTTDRVSLSAATPTGLYWGTRTLLQIAEQTKDQSLPCGIIKDEPAYGMRGFMIDCGRKYIPMDYLQNLVKIMSYYKMNTLQVHLNDNGFKQFFQNDWEKTYAAFRLESETYPGLTAEDGSYSKAEFRAFIKESAKLGVEIIPEIDAPAHTLAFAHYKKSLGSEQYGLDHLDLFNTETYSFMDGLWKEYLEGDDPVFAGPRVHIGTDEYSNKDPEVVEKFRAFTNRYINYVESFGKQACVWGALTHAKGETPVKVKNVIMSAWYNGYAQPKDMKKLGYDLISIPDGWVYIVPAAGYYYDYLDIENLYKEWTPAHIGEEVFEEGDPNILGGMFAVWNDHVGNGISVSDIHHRIFPALQTLAAKCWSASGITVPFESFDKQRLALSEAPGVHELGLYMKKPGILMELAKLSATSNFKKEFIGYNYRVSFTIEGQGELPGTVLLSSLRSTFYLADPIQGMLGFSRDGYLFQFTHRVMPGKHHIAIEGDNKATRLFIDGKMVEELNILTRYFDKEGKSMNKTVRTLVFPLQKTGDFKSEIFNFVVEQQP